MEGKDYILLLKDSIHHGMLENFKRDGYLTPIAFFLHKTPIDGSPFEMGEPLPVIIPIGKYIGDLDWKQSLSYAMHKMCENPLIIAAGLVMEGSGAKFHVDDELGKLVQSGAVKISELKEKQDIIMMMFSTPIEEELFIYNVDVKNKTIGERFPESHNFNGLMANLFGWNKN